jgi:hypothetical protein
VDGILDTRACQENCALKSSMLHPTTVGISWIPREIVGKKVYKMASTLSAKPSKRQENKSQNLNIDHAPRSGAVPPDKKTVPPPAFTTHPKYRRGHIIAPR